MADAGCAAIRPGYPLTSAHARAAVLLFGAMVLSHDIRGAYHWNDAIHCHFARNHLHYGLAYTQGYNTWGETREPPSPPQRYLNHPPLLSLILALPIALFGESEWVGRLVPITATLASSWLLMIMVTRLRTPSAGVTTGLLFFCLPSTAYFGRMIDHVAIVQLFSLLMVHAYLLGTGRYGSQARKWHGRVCYALASALGIGTGWGAALMPPILAVWHGLSSRRANRIAGRDLQWIIGWPAAALSGVVLHIAAAANWDVFVVVELFATRTYGAVDAGLSGEGGWLLAQARHFGANFTPASALAVLIFVIGALLDRRTAGLSSVPRLHSVAIAFAIHGLTYVILFRNQSWKHDYWQFHLAPLVAISWATAVAVVHQSLLCRRPVWRIGAVAALLTAALAGFGKEWMRLHAQTQLPRQYIAAFKELDRLVPERSLVMTSRDWPRYEESFAGYTNRWTIPQVAYYAARPLVFEPSLVEAVSNNSRAVAYLLEMDGSAESLEMARYFLNHYKTHPVDRHHLIVLLNEPRP